MPSATENIAPDPPLGELFNLGTKSRGLRLAQRWLGLVALQELYDIVCSKREESESFVSALLRELSVTWAISPQDEKRLPAAGGALVVANHPFGLIEGVVMTCLLQRVRPDVRVMTNSLLGRFPEVAATSIFVDPFGGTSARSRNGKGLRDTLTWLKRGGILGVFPAGEVSSLQPRCKQVVDPDWNDSVARLAAAANVPVVPMFFEGQNALPFQLAGLAHPRLRTALLVREFLNKRSTTLRIRVGSAIPASKLRAFTNDEERIRYLRRKTYLLANRKDLVNESPRLFPVTARFARRPAATPASIVTPTDAALMEREIALLGPGATLDVQGENAVYVSGANSIPNVVREIGRLREVTFRASGEGTGREIDLDSFDSYYLHLFVWNSARREIAGAYRIAESDRILRSIGRRGLYTSTLFSCKRAFLEQLGPALEMGRSFVRIEYQKSYAALLLLWRGIGAFVARNPRYNVLFGPVSISNEYHPGSRCLIVQFLQEYCAAGDLARLVRAKSPFRAQPVPGWDALRGGNAGWDIEELSASIADIEADSKGLPILLRQYLKLGGKLVGFNVDAAFSNALDGLIVVDLLRTDKRLLERYLGKEGSQRFLKYHAANDGTPAMTG